MVLMIEKPFSVGFPESCRTPFSSLNNNPLAGTSSQKGAIIPLSKLSEGSRNCGVAGNSIGLLKET